MDGNNAFGNNDTTNTTKDRPIRRFGENVKEFFTRMGKHAYRIILGIMLIITTGLVIWWTGIVLIAVGGLLKSVMENISKFCLNHMWVMAIIFAIIGYTVIESIERYRIYRENKRKNKRTRRR